MALGARRVDRLETLAAEIEGHGGRAVFQGTDVRRREDVAALVEAARGAFGPIDILVANAGVMPLSPLAELRVADWEAMVDVNVKGVLYSVAEVLPDMLAREGGHIVTVGSVAGRRPFPGGSVYSATKFAVRGLAWGMHLELGAEHGIRVTDVQPGVVATELADHIPSAEAREAFRARWGDKRPLEPEDVARAVLQAVTAPPHVSVSEILVRPSDQPT